MLLKGFLAAMCLVAAIRGSGEIILEQPKEYGVYQRNDKNVATIPVLIANTPRISSIRYRYYWGVDKNESAWQNLEFSQKGDHATTSCVLPAGGWYKLEFGIAAVDSPQTIITVGHVGVGEVFITAGQSNSANWGEPKQKCQTGMVVAFNGHDWQLANDPMPICGGKGGSIWPLVGDALATRLQVPIGFLCLGVGSSSVRQWDPNSPSPDLADSKSLDGLYQRFIKKYVPLLKPYGYRAVLWHQGETDREMRSSLYYKLLKNLITTFQAEFAHASWMVAIIGNQWMNPEYGKGCRAAQTQLINEQVAAPGPDTDQLGEKYRQLNGRSSHFNQEGLSAHAQMWVNAIMQEFFKNERTAHEN